MNLEYFPHFFRKNYPMVEASQEEIEEIGTMFKEYMQNKFKGKEDKLEKIWNIDPAKVISRSLSPFHTNGYEPALIIHFGNFVEEMKNNPPESE